jgi:hypothetical protein
MKVLNVHERELETTIDRVGGLIDSLTSQRDRLWPRQSWPAMKFDRPLGAGARGGHGPIRYDVQEYSPGLYIKFHFTGPKGFDGYHAFDIITVSDRSVKLRHTVKMETRGLARLSWPLVFEPMHDALLEDALATAQASLGLSPTIYRWTPWVRFLRWLLSGGKARPQSIPEVIL